MGNRQAFALGVLALEACLAITPPDDLRRPDLVAARRVLKRLLASERQAERPDPGAAARGTGNRARQ